jgi:3-isopropylmalate dehydratase small subunit
MLMVLKGSGPAVCIGDDIDTDLVIAGRYLRTKDWKVWAAHVFEDLDPTLADRLSGAVLVAGKNMGCGSSREQAARALVEAGVVAVIAPSFARIFFRNCINVGLPVLNAIFLNAGMASWCRLTALKGGLWYTQCGILFVHFHHGCRRYSRAVA